MKIEFNENVAFKFMQVAREMTKSEWQVFSYLMSVEVFEGSYNELVEIICGENSMNYSNIRKAVRSLYKKQLICVVCSGENSEVGKLKAAYIYDGWEQKIVANVMRESEEEE